MLTIVLAMTQEKATGDIGIVAITTN